MTTNHIENLDAALLRPGRTDLQIKLSNASYQQMLGLFDRFYPDQKHLGIDFANQLPVNKIGMAKLQGHFLAFRDSPEEAVKHARDLISEEVVHVTEMLTKEWLHRLNLLHLYKNFKKNKLTRVNHLKLFKDENELNDNELTEGNQKHCTRMWEMITGHDEAKENFKYLSKHGLRQVAMQYLDKEKEITELVESVPEKALTGFHLRDILAFKTNFAAIRTKILDTVLFNMRFSQKLYHFQS